MRLIIKVFSYTIVDSYFQKNVINSEGWSVHNHDGRSLVDTCNKYSLFGYFDQQNALVRGIQLPPHNGAQLEIVLWMFNKWAKEDVIEIWLDQKLLFSGGQPAFQGECDGEQFSTKAFTQEITHQEESAILIIYAKLKEQNLASWGISHFTFSVNLCTDNLFCQSTSDQFWELSYQFWNSYDLKKFNAEGWSGSTAIIQCGVSFFGVKYSAIETKKRTFTLKPNYKSKIKFLFARFSNGQLGLNKQIKTIILTIKVNGVEQIQSKNLQLEFDLARDMNKIFACPKILNIFIDSPNDKIDFEITSNEKNQGWGLRDFNLYIQPCSHGCIKCHGPLGSDCNACNDKYYSKDKTGCIPKVIDSQMVLFSQSFKEETFQEYDLWEVYSQGITFCSPFSIYGGYKQFDSHISSTKKFKLPSAKSYKIKFDLYAFGLWNNQYISIEVGAIYVYELKIKVDQTDFIQCGSEKLQGKIIPVETKLLTQDLNNEKEMTLTIASTLESTSQTKLPSWGFRNFELLYDPKYDCALLFTQINYKGDFVELCQSNIDFGLLKFPTSIKSIMVPPLGKVALFQKSEYSGKRYIFTENTPIIEEELFLHLDAQNEQINDL